MGCTTSGDEDDKDDDDADDGTFIAEDEADADDSSVELVVSDARKRVAA
jgi:hypothetical protein